MKQVKLSDIGLTGFSKILIVDPKSKKQEIFKIGHSKVSATFLPQHEVESTKSINFVDCAGFMDNRNSETSIANSLNIKGCFQAAKEVKICILISYQTLKSDRGRSCADLIKILIELFGSNNNLEIHSRSIIIICTQAESDALEEVKFLLTDGTSIKYLKEQIYLYNPIDENKGDYLKKDAVLSIIEKIPGIKEKTGIFNTVVTPEDELKLPQ
jgi:hypothetical protein